MLSKEEAQKQLEAFRQPGWTERVSHALKALPDGKGVATWDLLFGKPPQGMSRYQHMSKAQWEAATSLEALDEQQRRAVFEALFPKLSEAMERCWQQLVFEPFTGSRHGIAQPFRRPSDVRLTTAKRGDWLHDVCKLLWELDPDPIWLASWAVHLDEGRGRGWTLMISGRLLAAVIDQGGEVRDEVMAVLMDSANGQHPIGGMGRHVVWAMLASDDVQAWAWIEKLLLAAQRQEGLRQTILETVDWANPKAFVRMLRLILDEDLLRFASVMRAAACWFGAAWDSAATQTARGCIDMALGFLADPATRHQARAGNDCLQVHMALWAQATEDADVAVEQAEQLMDHDDEAIRFTATWFALRLGPRDIDRCLIKALKDTSSKVLGLALNHLPQLERGAASPALFDALAGLLDGPQHRYEQPAGCHLQSMDRNMSRSDVLCAMLEHAGPDRLAFILPHVPAMDARGRTLFLRSLLAHTKPGAKTRWNIEPARACVLTLLGDRSTDVHYSARWVLERMGLKPGDAETLEDLLTRKAEVIRSGVLHLLGEQPDAEALASVDRLLASKKALQRTGGVNLLVALADKPSCKNDCAERAKRLVASEAALSGSQMTLLMPLLDQRVQTPVLHDALGLMHPDQLTRTTPLPAEPVEVFNETSFEILKSLQAFLQAHAEQPIEDGNGQPTDTLLGTLTWQGLPTASGETIQRFAKRIPLADLWEQWAERLPEHCQDPDGLHFLRAYMLASCLTNGGDFEYINDVGFGLVVSPKLFPFRQARVMETVLGWLAYRLDPATITEHFLKVLTRACAMVLQQSSKPDAPADNASEWTTLFGKVSPSKQPPWVAIRNDRRVHWHWLVMLVHHAEPWDWLPEHAEALLGLLKWIDQPVDAQGMPVITMATLDCPEAKLGGLPADIQALVRQGHMDACDVKPDGVEVHLRQRMPSEWFIWGFARGVYNVHDAFDHLIGPGESVGRWQRGYRGLEHATTPQKKVAGSQGDAAMQPVVDRALDRLLEVECDRGELGTAATAPLQCVVVLPGLSRLTPLLKGLGQLPFVRSNHAHALGADDLPTKAVSLSGLVQITVPLPEDSLDAFKAAMVDAGISQERLVDLGLHAPQWAEHVAHALGWDGYASGVWWIHAHTKDEHWQIEKHLRDRWGQAIAERTPLEAVDLYEGAVDVAWFWDARSRLTAKQWQQIHASAKLASSHGGHKRSQLFADAMTGNLTKTALVKRIKDKRNQDAVRALGLLPLQRGAARDKDLLSRYETFQAFLQQSKAFGAQRRASESRAVEIGMANLARTAGMADPLRLTWAMEARQVEDLKSGSIECEVGPTRVCLAIDDLGEPDITVQKQGKLLKTVPAAAKKDKVVKALLARKNTIKKQATRMRASLEQMMCRGDAFEGREMAQLCEHPVMRPLLERLVFVGEGIMGFPAKGGRVLADHRGQLEPVKQDEPLRLAHPVDLLAQGDWSDWQRHVFAREMVQPFKQVFRELYLLTETEKNAGVSSGRFAGHQVNPSQALALLGKRGWIFSQDMGVHKTFHKEKITAWFDFEEAFYTPADLDGLTIDAVHFSRSGRCWEHLPLQDTPPALFSEVMRDLDLVVSVAHRGGVDPEACASTVDMRANLLRETLAVLNIDNVRIENNHAHIQGVHGKYALHLGSATTHLMPGGALFIVPVHSQHRGRLFLPFADDDPKTAEVLSKVLLLARDQDLKDPNLLDQIRAIR